MTLTINDEQDLHKILKEVENEHQKYLDMLLDPIATHERLMHVKMLHKDAEFDETRENVPLQEFFVQHGVYDEFRWLII